MFWRQTRLQLQTNLRLYQTCILSILLYGSETWTLLQEDLRKLEVFQVRSQRMILGSQDTLVWLCQKHRSCRPDWPSLCSGFHRHETNSLFGHVVRLDDHTPAHRSIRSQQQEPAPVLVLVGGDGQDARAIHGSSRSATVHHSAFVLNGPRLVVVATLGWRNGSLLSTRSDDDDD